MYNPEVERIGGYIVSSRLAFERNDSSVKLSLG